MKRLGASFTMINNSLKTLLIIAILLYASVASAQTSSSTARRVRGGNTLPATCRSTNPVDVYVDTDAAVGARWYVCTSVNTWTSQGGGGTPGGSDTQVQFNDSGALGGDAGLTYNKTTDILFVNAVQGISAGNVQLGTAGGSGFINFYTNNTARWQITSAGNIESVGGAAVVSPTYKTTTNCADNAGAAACGAAAAGAVVIDAAATTVVVSTTAVTATSRIFIQEDTSLATELSVTCNATTGRLYRVTARTAATSFTITASAAPTTNPACLSYTIVN